MTSSRTRKHAKGCTCQPCLISGIPNTEQYTKDPVPMDDLPDILKYDGRSRYKPPKFYYGWIVDPQQILSQAERYDVVQVYAPDSVEDDYYEAGDPRKQIDEDSWLRYKGDRVDLVYTTSSLASRILRPYGFKPFSISFVRAVRVGREVEVAVVICDNHSLRKMPAQEVISQIQNYMGFTHPPQWLRNSSSPYWEVRGLRHTGWSSSR